MDGLFCSHYFAPYELNLTLRCFNLLNDFEQIVTIYWLFKFVVIFI